MAKARKDEIDSWIGYLQEGERKTKGNTFQSLNHVLPNSSLTEREDELAVGFKKYQQGKNGLSLFQRKQKGKENLSKPCVQLFCCMMKKWQNFYTCPNKEDAEELARMSLGIRSVSYYRDWTSRDMEAELEKVYKGLDACGGYCLCMKSGKFLKHVQSNIPDGKSLKGLFPKMVYIIPIQMDIIGTVNSTYSMDMIVCTDFGKDVPRVKLLSHKANNCFDESRFPLDGLKMYMRPKAPITAEEEKDLLSEKGSLSQGYGMENEGCVDSNTVEVSENNLNGFCDKVSPPENRVGISAPMSTSIYSSSHSPYNTRLYSHRSRSSTSSRTSCVSRCFSSESTKLSKSTRSSSRRHHSNYSTRNSNSRKNSRSRSTSLTNSHGYRSSRPLNSRKRSRNISTPSSCHINRSARTSKSRKRSSSSRPTSRRSYKNGSLKNCSFRKNSRRRSASRTSCDVSRLTAKHYSKTRSRNRSTSRTSSDLSLSATQSHSREINLSSSREKPKISRKDGNVRTSISRKRSSSSRPTSRRSHKKGSLRKSSSTKH